VNTTRLKQDLFGTVTRVEAPDAGTSTVLRDVDAARWWTRPLARLLASREARALAALAGFEQIPQLIAWNGHRLERTWIEGRPMHVACPREPDYYRAAQRLVRRLHAAGVAHNDLAKEPNWLVDAAGQPALVDFQLATVSARRGRWFRALAHDDLRHLLKHKRTYCPERLTARERRILATPSSISRTWRRTGKPAYRFVTRRIFGWADREGAGDRSP
jgi:RIO-like serine/threonine protein kinase